jgi:radical SAM enzyme (TIGR01210 family)
VSTSSVLSLRPPRNAVDPARPYAFFVEEEAVGGGETVPVATIFLTNRECPWRCVMCDLWKNTLAGPTPKGAIPEQIRFALAALPPARHVKLYNSGSFFDKGAIPEGEYAEIASLVTSFERVVVECHPALVGDRCLRFKELLGATGLEIAMGLETAHAEALKKLDKGMTVEDFERSARFLAAHDVRLRSFVLLGVPFLRREEWVEATRVSIDVSFAAGASVVSLIPTRLGNGAMDELKERGQFDPPSLEDLENAQETFFERGLRPGTLLVDLWDVDRLSASACCRAARVERLRLINLLQRNLPGCSCPEGRRHSPRTGIIRSSEEN